MLSETSLKQVKQHEVKELEGTKTSNHKEGEPV